MCNSIVPLDLLQKSSKILFITHLAIGDFTYLQNYFENFAKKFPHIKIDLWVDQGRGKSLIVRWGRKDKNYVLHDWLNSCAYFNKIYINTASLSGLLSFLKKAKEEKYPIVVNLGTIKFYRYANFAKKISPNGFITGLAKPVKFYHFIKKYHLRSFNKYLNFDDLKESNNFHITDLYAFWFEKLFGMKVENNNRRPFINVPKDWLCYGKLKFLKWNIKTENKVNHPKVFFINSFAKNKKRCWPIDKVFKLITQLKRIDSFYYSSFIVNVLPHEYTKFEKSLKNYSKQNIFLFTADTNFFQLPAIIKLVDIVISVETSIMHLAAALNVPILALMRKKNPEWFPLTNKKNIIYTRKRTQWVKDISVNDVIKSCNKFLFN